MNTDSGNPVVCRGKEAELGEYEQYQQTYLKAKTPANLSLYSDSRLGQEMRSFFRKLT